MAIQHSFNLDPETGMVSVVVGGNTTLMNYRDYMDWLDQAIDDHVDGLKELRNPRSDTQNLWGNKNNAFRDDVYFRAKPIKRPKGYPDEFSEDDWKNGV